MTDYVKVPRGLLVEVARLLEIHALGGGSREDMAVDDLQELLSAKREPVEEVEVVCLIGEIMGEVTFCFNENRIAPGDKLMTVAQHRRILAAHNE